MIGLIIAAAAVAVAVCLVAFGPGESSDADAQSTPIEPPSQPAQSPRESPLPVPVDSEHVFWHMMLREINKMLERIAAVERAQRKTFWTIVAVIVFSVVASTRSIPLDEIIMVLSVLA